MAVFGTIFFPSIRLSPFAPFLAIFYHRVTFSRALWLSLGVGAILDLLSAEIRFGLYGLTFVLTTTLLYHQKRHFFEDKEAAFSLFSAIISATSTLLLMFFQELPLNGRAAFTNLVVMPSLDGIYAFLWFTCPMRLYTYIEKVGWKALFKRPQENEET